MVCNSLDAITEDDKPLHVITTDMAVTEVYGDGLTIIRAAPGCRDAAERPLKFEQVCVGWGCVWGGWMKLESGSSGSLCVLLCSRWS